MQGAAAILLVLFLAACSGPHLPLAKDQPLAPSESLAQPPWEALVKAGPGAENDIDLETLNGPQAQATPETVEVQKAQPDPNAVAITAVAIPQVKGAPGHGNAELTAEIRAKLADTNWPVVNTPQKNTLVVTGLVSIRPAATGLQKVSIDWTVAGPDGKKLGNVHQENDVPTGAIAQGFGENAQLIAEGAAQGIFELIKPYQN
jgi:hypothetical protein